MLDGFRLHQKPLLDGAPQILLNRTLPADDVSDSNDSIIQASTDYNPRERFPSMGRGCLSVDFVSVDSQNSGTHVDVKMKLKEML